MHDGTRDARNRRGAGRAVVIRGGRVIDGAGGPPRLADVRVQDGRIVALEAGAARSAGGTVVDAAGCIVAPGFIDIHTHSDISLVHDPRGESKILQGVTTEVIGNCSFSAFPIEPSRVELHSDHLARIGDDPIMPGWTDLDGYAAVLERQGIALNVAPLVGHGSLRVAAMGLADRAPTQSELARMVELADQAFEQGAFGISSGLTHVPSAYADAAELHVLAAVAYRHGRLYATHARAQAGWTMAAIEEAVAVGRSTGVRVELSHLAINEPDLWGTASEVLAVFEGARATGVDIRFDVYPYDASCSSLSQYLPAWLQEGGTGAMLARLAEPLVRARALEEIAQGWWGGIPWRWERVVLSRTGVGAEDAIGLSLAALASREGRAPEVVMLDLCERFGNEVEVVLFYRTEEDMLSFLRHPLAAVGSDGSAIPLDQGSDKPHPRHFGTFPRVLGRYVRDVGALDLADAIARMTSRPADRLGLADRGRLAPGMAADIVVFDPDRIADTATFEEPCRAPLGVRHVLVAGVLVVEDGRQTPALPGRVLRAAA